MHDQFSRKHIGILKDRLARIRRGEVWRRNGRPGPYSSEEMAAEIAWIEAAIARAEAGQS
jgi:hypothetical protein